MKKYSKRTWLAAGSIPVLLVAGAGVAAAQDEETPSGDDPSTDTDGTDGTDGTENERRGRKGAGRHGARQLISALGFEDARDELREQLAAGTTIAEIAEAEGVDLDAVIAGIVADAEARVAEKLEMIGDERPELAERLQNFDAEALSERLTELSETDLSEKAERGFGRRGDRRGFGGGRGGDAPADGADAGADAVDAATA